jgi:cell division transport system permease protein
VRTWLAGHRAAIADAIQRLLSAPFATLLSVVAIGTALTLPLALYLAIDQAGGIAKHLSQDPKVSVYLAAEAGRDDARGVEQRLRQHAQVANVEYIPRDAALVELERSAGLGDVRASLGHNPLPDAFVATVRGGSPAAIEALRVEVAAWPRVEHVQADAQWAQRLQALLALGRGVVLVLSVVLGVLLAAITFNTIRLQILARKEEIEVSKLIGATNGFVRRPFVYLGLLQGLAGGGFALLLTGIAVWGLNRELGGLAMLYQASFRMTGPGLAEALAVCGGAAGLGALGAWVSASKHLSGIGKITR